MLYMRVPVGWHIATNKNKKHKKRTAHTYRAVWALVLSCCTKKKLRN